MKYRVIKDGSGLGPGSYYVEASNPEEAVRFVFERYERETVIEDQHGNDKGVRHPPSDGVVYHAIEDDAISRVVVSWEIAMRVMVSGPQTDE